MPFALQYSGPASTSSIAAFGRYWNSMMTPISALVGRRQSSRWTTSFVSGSRYTSTYSLQWLAALSCVGEKVAPNCDATMKDGDTITSLSVPGSVTPSLMRGLPTV